MSARGNPYDNAKAESFMKTLKSRTSTWPYETFADVADRFRSSSITSTTPDDCTPRLATERRKNLKPNTPRKRLSSARSPGSSLRGSLHARVSSQWKSTVSIRRACSVLEFDRSTYHYKSRRREQAGLEARIKEICATRVRRTMAKPLDLNRVANAPIKLHAVHPPPSTN